MGLIEYKENKMVILVDEVYYYLVSIKKEKDDECFWERMIELILELNVENWLLEFMVIIDLENKYVYEKYKDKIIFCYLLDKYIFDGYLKNIWRI